MQIDSNKKLEQFLNNEFSKLRSEGKIINPNSKYFPEAGSTSLEDISYESQLSVKLLALKNIFQTLNAELLDTYEITASPKEYEYRFKMDFISSFNPMHEPNSRFGQRKKKNFNWIVDMDECNLIEKEWFKKIRDIYNFLQEKGIRNYDVKMHTGELRYIVSKIYNDEAMLIFIVANLDNKSIYEEVVKAALGNGFKSIYLQLNSSVSDLSFGENIQYWGEDHITIPLKLNNEIFKFKVKPNTFFQNNIYCFEQMLSYIESFISRIDTKSMNLIDLYCGVGTIGICFAKYFKKLYGIEIINESIELANENAKLNHIKNAVFQTADLSNYEIKSNDDQNFLIVDPPRTGLEGKSIEELLKFKPKYIVYISCNSVTQARDLKKLNEANYKVESIRAFDMFPQTNHIENVVIMEEAAKETNY